MQNATRRSVTEARYNYDVSPDSLTYARKRGAQTAHDEPYRHRQSTSEASAQRLFRTGGGAFSADNGPPDGDPDDDPSDPHAKRHLEIFERRRKDTLINSEYLTTSKFVTSVFPLCEM